MAETSDALLKILASITGEEDVLIPLGSRAGGGASPRVALCEDPKNRALGVLREIGGV